MRLFPVRLTFLKAQALGNDFLIVDARSPSFRGSAGPRATWVRQIAERRQGVGFDQLLWLEPGVAGVAAMVRIFNADGGEVGQCGNGLRCVGRYLFTRGEGSAGVLSVRCAGGPVTLSLRADGWVQADMGAPCLEPAKVPFTAASQAITYALEVAGESVEAMVLSLGNPHAVLRVERIEQAPVACWGAALCAHARFPQGVNVTFMQVAARDAVLLRVYERGVGETPACGSGACAAVAAGRLRGWLDHRVRARFPGGELEVHYEGGDRSILLAGPAEIVYEGNLQVIDDETFH